MRMYSSRSLRPLVLASLCGLLLFGSNIGAPTAWGAAANRSPQSAPEDQAGLSREVRHVLVLLPFYSVFDNLAYKVEGNKVTLLGQVVRPVLKDDAEKAVKSVQGVESVDNQIEVLPTSPMDDQIRRAEYRAIYSKPSLQMYEVRSVPPIHIIVKNGHVTLEGVVATQADKDVAGIAANTVPNVFSVTNNLRVERGGSK
jgi:hyperosmotically inducible periplasmic protein